MKKILLQIFAVLLALAIVPAGLLFFAFGLPTQFENTFLAELPDKCRLLEETEGRRIVVIGGSGAAFGLRCDLLEEALPGYSAVNFGMYAGLGTVVMLDLVLPRLREGDVVIFSPEQSEQTLSAYLGGQYLWQAAEGNLKILSSLRPEDRCTMLGAFPYFAAQKARFFRDGTTPSGEGVYAHSSFNRYGDIDYPNRETNVMVNGWDENMPISFDEQLLQEDFLNRFCSFVAQCEKKGIRVFYRFCPMNAAAISSEERTHIRAFEDALKEKINCPILGDADSAILDAGWFYDTNFHLNSAGAVVNTARLAQQLQKALNISGSTIALPGMPGTVQAQEVPGDDRDADCFQYRQTEKGIVIVGLMTDQKSLTLPTFAHGEAVVGFTEEAFAGNTTVEEIVLQSNITSIPDGALFGCTNLKRLVVMNTSPSACTVGAGLLEGTNAHIFVPGESYGSYVTNYFWSVHASRIRQNKLYQPEQQEEAELPPISGQSIRYMGNGGVTKDGKNYFDKPMDTAHLRVNTALGTRYFERPGYIPVGWNTEPDGSGKRVGFGSRTERRKRSDPLRPVGSGNAG